LTVMASMVDWPHAIAALADERQADFVAIEDGERAITVRQLDGWMRSAATSLAGEEGAVVICDSDPVRHTAAVLGAIAAGRPALLVDHKHPPSVLDAVATQAGATVAIGRSVRGCAEISFDALTAPRSQPNLAGFDANRIGSIILTSGSTGVPKLVARTRRADMWAMINLRLAGFPLRPGDRCWAPLPHAAAPFLSIIMGAIGARATIVCGRFEPKHVDRFLSEQRVDYAHLVPTMLRLAREFDGLEGPGWRRIRMLMTGGEKIDPAIVEALRTQFRSVAYCAYGMTEVPLVAIAGPSEVTSNPGTVGFPKPLTQVVIGDPDGEGRLAPNEEGEIFARAPDMYHGYLGSSPAGQWHRTGDLGTLDEDGRLFITGRASDVVQVGGNRISTDEVSSVLGEHPAVLAAAVVAVDDPVWTTRLVAFVVLRDGVAERPDLAGWLSGRLAPYKVPRAYQLMESLPMESSGKLSLKTLREKAESLALEEAHG
jgi:acyl-coenzyme A synthetase/AMP-(fatty) acid ligase